MCIYIFLIIFLNCIYTSLLRWFQGILHPKLPHSITAFMFSFKKLAFGTKMATMQVWPIKIISVPITYPTEPGTPGENCHIFTLTKA